MLFFLLVQFLINRFQQTVLSRWKTAKTLVFCFLAAITAVFNKLSDTKLPNVNISILARK